MGSVSLVIRKSPNNRQRLADAAMRGVIEDFAPGVADEEITGPIMDGWGSRHVVEAEDIRSVLLSLEKGDPRGLHVRGASIRGRLDLDDVVLNTPLCLIGCDLKDGLTAREASLRRLEVQGCRAQSTESDTPALDLQGASISGSLVLSRTEFNVSGGAAVRAGGLHVGEGAYLDEIRAEGGHISVFLSGARIGLGLSLAEARATGTVRLSGAHVEGPLYLDRAEIRGGDNAALVADGLRVDEAVFMTRGFVATADTDTQAAVHMTGADFGQLTMSDLSITNSDGPALVAEHLTVRSGTFLLDKVLLQGKDNPRPLVTFAAARLGPMRMAESWLQQAPGGWSIDGMTYSGVGRLSTEAWLAFFKSGMARYAAQPYQHCAALARASGHDRDARKILMAQRRDQIDRGRVGRAERAWARFTGITLGFGYQPWRALVWLGIVLAAAIVLVFSYGDSGLAHTSRSTEPGSPCSPVEMAGYAIDLAVPLIKTGARDTCAPVPGWDGDTIQVWGGLLQLAAWAGATLFVAGFTSAVRKT